MSTLHTNITKSLDGAALVLHTMVPPGHFTDTQHALALHFHQVTTDGVLT